MQFKDNAGSRDGSKSATWKLNETDGTGLLDSCGLPVSIVPSDDALGSLGPIDADDVYFSMIANLKQAKKRLEKQSKEISQTSQVSRRRWCSSNGQWTIMNMIKLKMDITQITADPTQSSCNLVGLSARSLSPQNVRTCCE
jgi:hypothetical protein